MVFHLDADRGHYRSGAKRVIEMLASNEAYFRFANARV
jgi:hypothetical protein